MSSSGSSSEEEDDEPILKYERFQDTSLQILANDSISAFTICSSLIILGSHNGIVYILNLKGTELSRYRVHAAAVSSLSIDTHGDTIASASIDGRVVLYQISRKETSMYDFKRPLRAVAIDPEYLTNGKGRVVSGGLAGKVVLNEKGWMGVKETVLGANEGPIMEISWFGNLIAWANDFGVRIYDVLNMRMVGIVERRANSARADLFKCRLLWQSKEVLIIGWFDLITKVIIHEGVGKVLNHESALVIKVDYIVSGLAMFGTKLLVVAYIADTQEIQDVSAPLKSEAERPEIRILDSELVEVSEDALGLRGYNKLQPNDYSIYAHPLETSYFIIGPKDIVFAKERDLSDHITWLIEMQKYEAALEITKTSPNLPLHQSYAEIGKIYLQHLLDQNDYSSAAKLTPELYLEDVEAWEKCISQYEERGHLDDLTPYIPTEQPILSSSVYEDILRKYITTDHDALLVLVQKWPVEIYNIDDIILAIQDEMLRPQSDKTLEEALACLYLKTDRPREALPYYLSLEKLETFELIEKYHLFDAIQDDVLSLVKLGTPAPAAGMSALNLANPHAIDLLVQHAHSIPISMIVEQLRDRPSLLYCYFRALLKHDRHIASDYSDLQISLFAEYDRVKLMKMLKSTTTYSLERAAKICEERSYIPELVFILGRMGDSKKAMKLIIEKLDDVQQAIDFAHAQADPDLWEDLISHSLTHPRFIRGLLENASSSIDPVTLIRRIPTGLVIDGLKDSLAKVFNDYDLQLSLSQCGGAIHRSDNASIAARLRKGQQRGLLLQPSHFKSLDEKPDTHDYYVFFDGTIKPRKRDSIKHRSKQSLSSKITESAIYKQSI